MLIIAYACLLLLLQLLFGNFFLFLEFNFVVAMVKSFYLFKYNGIIR